MVVGVELDPGATGDLAEGVPLVGRHVPVSLVGAAGGVATSAHVVHAEDVGDLQVLLEGVQVGGGQGPGAGDEAVVALRAQPVLVEPAAQQPGALEGFQVGAAGGVGVLAVAGELHLPVAVAGQLLEDGAEAGGQVGGERVAAGGVADRVEDDAALVLGDEQVALGLAVRLGGGRRLHGGRTEDGSGDRPGRHGGAGAQEAAAADAEAAAQLVVGALVGCVDVVHGCLSLDGWSAPSRPARRSRRDFTSVAARRSPTARGVEQRRSGP